MEWPAVTSVVVGAAAFIATQVWLVYQIKSIDDRANKKLRIFMVLSDERFTLSKFTKSTIRNMLLYPYER